MNPLADLLAGHDRWTGAACVGRWDLFDPRRDDEDEDHFDARIYRARTICERCPILEDCRDYAGNLRPRDRHGIWAGIYYGQTGRPNKETP